MVITLPPPPEPKNAGRKTPESPKNPLQLGCSVTQIRHFFKRTFFNLPLIFENNVKKATAWLHERDEIYRFCKASPFGRGVTAGDGEGEAVDRVQQPAAHQMSKISQSSSTFLQAARTFTAAFSVNKSRAGTGKRKKRWKISIALLAPLA